MAISASYLKIEERKTPLLAFSPLLDEECLDAASYYDFIESALEIFNRNVSDLLFVTCDNENTNKLLSDLLKTPMIGCASHRFNLSMKSFLKEAEIVIQKVNGVLKKLKGLKVRKTEEKDAFVGNHEKNHSMVIDI